MAAGDSSKTLDGVPGRLAIKSGSAFSSFSAGAAGFPFGGTELGRYREGVITRVEGTYEVKAEEWGQEVVEEIPLAEDWLVTVLFRSADPDVKRAIFPNIVAGAVSGNPVVQSSGGTVNPLGIGQPRSKRYTGGLRVLFMPDDAINHDSLYLPNAIVRSGREILFPIALREEAGYVATFRGLRPATGSGARWGRLADLS